MIAPSTYHLFVYGSLRSGFRNPAYAYLTRYFHFKGEAVVRGQMFDNGEFPVAVSATEDFFITGELYELNDTNEFSWAIEQLDDYEGLHVEEGEQALYKREIVTAYMEGQPTEAWVYWYNASVTGMQVIETGDILAYLQQKNKP